MKSLVYSMSHKPENSQALIRRTLLSQCMFTVAEGERIKVLWKQIIERHGGVLTSALNVSCLAKVTDGFTQGHIVQAVKDVLTDQRIRRQTYKPLTAVEFIMAITSMNPVYKEEEESFK
ncbi:Dynein regulatory complex protein 11, partial [Saguinus oedipus]